MLKGPPSPLGLARRDHSLLHRWMMNDVYTDSVGSITFVPQAGTPIFEAALIGNGVRVTPGNEQLLATGLNGGLIDGAGSFTICGWAKQNTADSHWYILYSIHASPFSNTWFLGHTAVSNQHFFHVIDGGNGAQKAEELTKITALGQWIFQAGVWDDVAEQGTYYFGINSGALQTRASTSSGWTGPRRKDNDALRSGFFTVGDVTLDEIRIWKEAKPSTFIQAIYDAEKP